jgi:hypothetical protein
LQVLLDAGDLRGLFEEMDSSSLARVPLNGSKSGRSGKMVKEPLLSEERRSTRTWQQGKKPKHHECALFSRNSLGVGGQEPDHQRSPERETEEVTRRSNPARDHGIPQGIVHPLRTMIELDAFTGLRRGELIGLRWQDVDFENLILHVRRSLVAMIEVPRRPKRRSKTFHWMRKLPSPFSIGDSIRHQARCDWVFFLPVYQRPTTVLARDIVAILRQACTHACRNNEAGLVSCVSPHVRNSPEREWRKPEGRAGTATSRQPQLDQIGS